MAETVYGIICVHVFLTKKKNPPNIPIIKKTVVGFWAIGRYTTHIYTFFSAHVRTHCVPVLSIDHLSNHQLL
jgi:hypothetical protein